MQKKIVYSILFLSVFTSLIMTDWSTTVNAQNAFQQATVVLPTVTGTASGPIVTVRSDQEEFVNVRSGPGLFYPKIGVILKGQQAPARGRSVGGDWILIAYPGIPGGEAWVYSPFVSITPGSLPIVEPPPTPTPQSTATIDPTLAAQFIFTSEPTRLPTFTPPPPLAIPTFTDESAAPPSGNVPVGLVIISLGLIGIFTGVFTLTQRR
jgi:uncharacterized protein YraI